MRYVIVMCIAILLVLTEASAQKTRKKDGKRATVVDSINTPPRMDGNTGKYDTVRKPMEGNDKHHNKVDYEYKMGTDSIKLKK